MDFLSFQFKMDLVSPIRRLFCLRSLSPVLSRLLPLSLSLPPLVEVIVDLLRLHPNLKPDRAGVTG